MKSEKLYHVVFLGEIVKRTDNKDIALRTAIKVAKDGEGTATIEERITVMRVDQYGNLRGAL